ncbi:MAG TPA: type II secretion system F family protein [Acidimicrobiales bacterium]|nr:type II secretion system F family protein [Acidimicrobiales bacterium]
MADPVTFRYRAQDSSGRAREGTVEGPDQRVVATRLREMGMTPLSIEEHSVTGLKREITLPGIGGGKKVKLKDLAVFSRQFATMIASGLTLLRSLNILAEQSDNAKLSEVIAKVGSAVEGGKALSEALAEHPEFPKLYVAMVRAGETSGTLDQVLIRIADTLEKDLTLRKKVTSALTYPGVVLVLAVLLTIVMLLFIVPTFVGMFETLGGELPLPTRVLLLMSAVVRKLWFVVFLLPVVAWRGFKRARKEPWVRARLDAFKLRAPVLGPLFHKLAIARFTRNLSTLLHAGVPILLALEITSDTVDNAVISRAVDDVRAAVKEGESVAKPLSNHPVFPPMVVQMTAVGEETGALDEMLGRIADFYDREVDATTESLTAALEPIMIAILGGIVGSMVIALYMPMFKIFDLVE